MREGEFAITLKYKVKQPSFSKTCQMEVFENPMEAKRHENPLYQKNNRMVEKSFFLSTVQNKGIIGLEDIILQA